MMAKSSIGLACPVDVLEDLVLFVPDRRHVSVGEKDQAEVAENSFRKIHDDIACRIPRQEYGSLCPAQRVNRAVQKPDTRVSSSWIWQDPKAIAHLRVR